MASKMAEAAKAPLNGLFHLCYTARPSHMQDTNTKLFCLLPLFECQKEVVSVVDIALIRIVVWLQCDLTYPKSSNTVSAKRLWGPWKSLISFLLICKVSDSLLKRNGSHAYLTLKLGLNRARVKNAVLMRVFPASGAYLPLKLYAITKQTRFRPRNSKK